MVAAIIGNGMVAFRDDYGIRPLVLGKGIPLRDQNTWLPQSLLHSMSLVTNLSVTLHPVKQSTLPKRTIVYPAMCRSPSISPCLFEFVYFARPDSFIDQISVYASRVNMGRKLGEKIAREWSDLDIDVVIPILNL